MILHPDDQAPIDAPLSKRARFPRGFDVLIENKQPRVVTPWESNFGRKYGGRTVALCVAAIAAFAAILLAAVTLVKTQLHGVYVSAPTPIFLAAFVLFCFGVVFLYVRLRVALIMNGLIIVIVPAAYGLVVLAH